MIFRRKPLGFDRKAGRYGLNSEIAKILHKKLEDPKGANLQKGYFIRKIFHTQKLKNVSEKLEEKHNDEYDPENWRKTLYVERLKFTTIESRLRNIACPMMIEFRVDEPMIPRKFLEQLEEKKRLQKERKRKKDRRDRKQAEIQRKQDADDQKANAEDANDRNPKEPRKRVRSIVDLKPEITIHFERVRFQRIPKIQQTQLIDELAENRDLSFIPQEGTELNAKVTNFGYKLHADGVRVHMFIHKVNDRIVDNERYDTIMQTLHALRPPYSITLSHYPPIDLRHDAVQRLLDRFAEPEVERAWKLLGAEGRDEILHPNPEYQDHRQFQKEMIRILERGQKRKRKGLFGRDLDIGKPIIIEFEKRPFEFEIESHFGGEIGKNAKIKAVSNEKYAEIGLKAGMFISKAGPTDLSNLRFTQIASLLDNLPLPMRITFTHRITLIHAKYVVHCKVEQKPFGFTMEPRDSVEMKQAQNAVIGEVTLQQKDVVNGMMVHSVNGIDVMDCMTFEEIQNLLDRLPFPIDIGFIDMVRVQRDLRNSDSAKSKSERNKSEPNNLRQGSLSEVDGERVPKRMNSKEEDRDRARSHSVRSILSQETFAQDDGGDETKKKRRRLTYCQLCREKETKWLWILYFFILTDLYCRIYPMLVIIAYTKRSLGDDMETWQLSLVSAGVLGLVFAYEGIAYKYVVILLLC